MMPFIRQHDNPSIEAGKQSPRLILIAQGEVTQVENGVILVHHRVPPGYQLRFHLLDVPKRAFTVLDDVRMSEMLV
jgi:hypothetical protein